MAPPFSLLEKMRRSKNGWRPGDLEELYAGFGFVYREGSKHRIYFHPVHKDLLATVKRADPLPVGYIARAVKLVQDLIEREGTG
jgi:hypothetical protein